MRLLKTRISKASFITRLVSLLCLITLIISSGMALAQSYEKHTANLIVGAKKEGKLVLYSTMSVHHSDSMLKRFEKKYPFIKTELYRAASSTLLNKITTEDRANRHTVDVIQLSGFQSQISKKERLSMAYISPEARAYQEGFKDPDGHWTSMYLLPYVMGFNTNLLLRKNVPVHYESFLDPKWKGKKIAFDVQEVEWFANMLKIMGEEKGIEFMKKLVAQDLGYRKGHTLITQLVIAGEFPIGTVYPQEIEERKKSGAPVDWVAVAPLIAKFVTTGVAANAPHPNAARLYTDFTLSNEGQMFIRDLGRVPARPDVEIAYNKALRGVKLYASDLSLAEDFSQYRDKFKDIFPIVQF